MRSTQLLAIVALVATAVQGSQMVARASEPMPKMGEIGGMSGMSGMSGMEGMPGMEEMPGMTGSGSSSSSGSSSGSGSAKGSGMASGAAMETGVRGGTMGNSTTKETATISPLKSTSTAGVADLFSQSGGLVSVAGLGAVFAIFM